MSILVAGLILVVFILIVRAIVGRARDRRGFVPGGFNGVDAGNPGSTAPHMNQAKHDVARDAQRRFAREAQANLDRAAKASRDTAQRSLEHSRKVARENQQRLQEQMRRNQRGF